MEPAGQSGGTGQTSPRGNDWEVVQLTTSNYASAPRSEPSDEEPEGQVYGTKGDDSALLMSGHFSVPRNEAQSLGAGSKECQEVRGSDYAVSDEGGDDRQDNLKDEDDLDRISSVDKGKRSLSSADTESDDGTALRWTSLAGEEPVTFSSSDYSANVGDMKQLNWSPTAESKTTEEKTEDPTLQNVEPVTASSEVAASGKESRPEGSGSGSGVPGNVWWRKQMISLYRSARESNKFWPVIVATAALMGMAYFRRRWLRGKLQLQQVKLQPASSKEVTAGHLPLDHTSHIFETEQTSWA
ncbi:unnamed protein product [Alopecurus aequalis]